MLQRIQTIFLALIAVAMVVALSTPLWEKSGVNPADLASLTALEYAQKSGISTVVTPVWYLGVLMLGVVIVAVYAITQYRNRLRQTLMCAINSLLMTGIMGITLYMTLYKGKEFGSASDQGSFLPGFYAIIAALVLNALANRAIRRDERKVRESERFR
jgi:glucan phosphoethanolaminetransferase (alkaline phosphatase superfamily)